MASGSIRGPGELDFSNAQEAWPSWIQRFKRYRSASGLDEKAVQKQVDTMIYCMGDEAEKVYTQLTIAAPNETETTANPMVLFDRTVTAFEEYFNPRNNHLHYSILLSNRAQGAQETNEEFIREIYEMSSKCGFTAEENTKMIKMRLLAGMRDKALARELQVDTNITLEDIKSKMRAKEIILNNQKVQQYATSNSGERTVAYVRNNYSGQRRGQINSSGSSGMAGRNISGSTTLKSQGRSWGEEDGYRKQGDFIQDCKFCGGAHARRRCPAYGKRCNRCSQFNHFSKSKVCKARDANSIETADSNNFDQDNQFLNLDSCLISDISSGKTKWFVELKTGDGKIFRAKVDTGAEVSVMPKTIAKSLGIARVQKVTTQLQSYSGNEIKVLGKIDLEISINNTESIRKCIDTFYVADDSQSQSKIDTLLGLPGIQALNLIPSIEQVSVDNSCTEILSKYDSIFKGLGKYNQIVSLQLKSDAVPKASAPRNVPEHLRNKLKAELDRLVSEEIITPDSSPSEWLSPPIIVNKPNGSIRLCLDPQYLNTQLVRNHCMLNTTTEIFSRLHGSKYFSCLDGKQGFHQLRLDYESSRLTCFLTPFGKFRYLRLPMGITNAPEIFHQTMMVILKDIPGVEIYIDDILVHAETLGEHNRRLELVLKRIKQAGITLNKEKSVFGQKSVVFLGHELCEGGVRPHKSKVKAIQEMVEPQDRKAAQSFLGFVGYLSKFIENLSELAEPIRQVCKKKSQFMWEKPQQDSFAMIKQAVIEAPTLALYDPNCEVVVSADSSAHSLGAVLLQNEKPVEFIAKSLTDTQQRYSQIEKEMLAILFAVKRFRYYLYGQPKILVETDHQPLIGIMAKPISELSPRLAQMRLDLLSYPVLLELKHKPGVEMILADVLSRTCPQGVDLFDDLGTDPLMQVCEMMITTDTAKIKYQEATKLDNELMKVMQYIEKGWPANRKLCAANALPYYSLRDTLSVAGGLVMYGSRVVIPCSLRDYVINKLHAAHQGVSKTLQRVQNSVFWPGIKKHVEDKCLSCAQCLSAEREGKKEPLMPFPVPEYPFQCLGADIFHVNGQNFLMLVDYLSKWPVVKCLHSSMTSRAVIQAMKEVFADFGTPEKIVSDFGSQFVSLEFRNFCGKMRIEHVTSSPLHHSSNGQAERTIGTVKNMMKRCIESGNDWLEGLVAIRNTPIDHGMLCPAQYLQGRVLRDRIPMLAGNYNVNSYDIETFRSGLIARKSADKYYHDRHAGKEQVALELGQFCYYRTANGRYCPGKVIEQLGDRTYLVEEADGGGKFRRNRKHIRVARANQSDSEELSFSVNRGQVGGPAAENVELDNETNENDNILPGAQNVLPDRPQRERNLPTHLRDYVVYYK